MLMSLVHSGVPLTVSLVKDSSRGDFSAERLSQTMSDWTSAKRRPMNTWFQ